MRASFWMDSTLPSTHPCRRDSSYFVVGLSAVVDRAACMDLHLIMSMPRASEKHLRAMQGAVTRPSPPVVGSQPSWERGRDRRGYAGASPLTPTLSREGRPSRRALTTAVRKKHAVSAPKGDALGTAAMNGPDKTGWGRGSEPRFSSSMQRAAIGQALLSCVAHSDGPSSNCEPRSTDCTDMNLGALWASVVRSNDFTAEPPRAQSKGLKELSLPEATLLAPVEALNARDDHLSIREKWVAF
jgi:hypothetical protein